MGFCSISLLYALILTGASMTFGAIIAYGSATLRIIKVTFGPLSTFYVGAFQAAPAFMAIFSPILWNYLLKRFSLKICTSILGFSGATFWLLLLTMNKHYFWLLVIIRGLLGTTLAGSSAIGPLYFSAIAPPEHKGFYCMIHCLFVIIGHITTNLLGVTHKWQPPIYLNSASLLIAGIGVYIVKENDENTNNISTTTDNLAEDASIELKNLENKEEEKPPSIGLFDRSIRKTTIVALSLLFLMQLSGIGSIMQNLAPLMSEVGLDFDAGYQATIAICAQLFSSILQALLIDRFGCRNLWIFSSFGSTISLLLYSLNVKFKWSRWLPMIFLFCFQFFFGSGMGSIPWIYPAQVFPKELTSKELSLGTSLTWTSASIVMFLFPYLKKWLGQFGLMLILTGINFFSFLVGVLFVKDNRNMSADVENTNEEIKQVLINDDTKSNVL